MKKNNIVKLKFFEYIGAVRYCIKLSWCTSKGYTMTRLICEIVVPMMGILTAFFSKFLLYIFAGNLTVINPHKLCVLYLGCILIFQIIKNVGNKLIHYIQSLHESILEEKIAVRLMDCATNVKLECFDNADYYDVLQSGIRDSSAIIQIMWNALSFISSSVSFCMIFVIFWLENPLYGGLLLGAAIPYAIVSSQNTKALYTLSVEQISTERKKSYYQSLTVDKRYAQEIRLFQLGDYIKEKYHHIWNEIIYKRKRILRKWTCITILLSCLPEIVSFFIKIDIGFKILDGKLLIGDYSLYAGLITQFLSLIFNLVFAFTNIYDNKLKIMNLKKIYEFETHVLDGGKYELKQIDNIEFEHVSFAYPQTHSWVLNDVNFVITKEQKTVFVGINGSGKTTIVKLILRFYDPTKGKIKINGLDIKEYSLKSIRECFSVYFQEMNNYCFTLFENIIISDLKRVDKENSVLEALKKCDCADILQKAQNGILTSLTRIFDKDGIELSGGQNQKIALARVLYRQGVAFILDEPSSNLDPKAEHIIFENIKDITDGRLTIFTSHRLSNIFLADRVIVLEKGRIVEDGSKTQLLKGKGRFAELYRYQEEKFQI